MNIKFTQSWLKEVLVTPAKVEEIAKGLTSCGQVEIESLEKKGNDWVWQVEVTNNRPDAFSVLGIARECQAILPQIGSKARCRFPKGIDLKLQPEVAKLLSLKVKIAKKGLCPRFTAIILDNIKIKPSPKKIAERLETAGIRAINNVVDVSNYLMLELGQPMHTFDFDKIKDSKMLLRESTKGEKIITLDGVERVLPKGAIVIEDEKRLIDLCGIMGGLLSEVDNNTKRVLLFVQTYDPQRIRKTTQAINHRTEASSRFEKGLDAENVMPAIRRATFLLKKHADAKIASELIDIYPQKYQPYPVTLNLKTLDTYMDTKIPTSEVKRILQKLGLKVQKVTSKVIEVLIPSWRAGDIQIEEDLIEEVARIFGYQNIKDKLPKGRPLEIDLDENKIFFWEKIVKDTLKDWGFYEVYSSSLVSKDEIQNSELLWAVKLKNPLNENLEYLRTSLLPSLEKVFEQNSNFKKVQGYFELSNVYKTKGQGLPEQKIRLAAVTDEKELAKAKGYLIGLFQTLKIDKIKLESKKLEHYKVSLSFEVKANNTILGTFGQLKKKNQRELFAFDLDFEEIAKISKYIENYKPIPRFPTLIEDIDIIVDERIHVGKVIETIFSAAKKNIAGVDLIDIYGTGKIGENKKSLTLKITFQAKNRTLTSREVAEIKKEIEKELNLRFGGRFRGFSKTGQQL